MDAARRCDLRGVLSRRLGDPIFGEDEREGNVELLWIISALAIISCDCAS